MLSLSIGFCISQVLRYAVHGSLPKEIAHFGGAFFKSVCYSDAWALFLFAVLFGAGACGILKLQAEYGKREHHSCIDFERYIEFTKLTLVMTMAWNLLFSVEWTLLLMYGQDFLDRKVLKHVILALVISYFSIAVIFGLDFLANKFSSPVTKNAGRLLGKGFGLSVAFSWEITFDVSVSTIADSEEVSISGPVLKLIMATFLISMVAPAWANYVLPHAMEQASRPSRYLGATKTNAFEGPRHAGCDKSEDSVGEIPAKFVQTQESDIDGIMNLNSNDQHPAHSADDGCDLQTIEIAEEFSV
jgi:hypothetical protein